MTRIIKKFLRKKRLYASLLLVLGFGYFYSLLDVRTADEPFIQQLNNNVFGYEASVHHYDYQGRHMRYVELGNDSLPLLIFVHGAPASSSFWTGLLRDSTLLANAKLLAFDRPGYGYSDYGDAETSVAIQSEVLQPLLEKKSQEHKEIYLHGSSYGGTLVARLAMDYSDTFDGIILQSASVLPYFEKTYWVSYPMSHPLLKWAVPKSIQVANEEKLSHHEPLLKMTDLWDQIKSPTIILHGGKDELIYTENAYYSFDKLKNAAYRELVIAKERGHDLLWTRTELLKESILKLIHKQLDRPNQITYIN